MTLFTKSLAIFIGTASLAAGLFVSAIAYAGFVGGIDDLPLMPGLTEAVDEGVVFETPQGRIVEATASGKHSKSQVLEFYDRALPQLGWVKSGEGQYRREDEVLVIEFQAEPSPIVRFRLAPGQ